VIAPQRPRARPSQKNTIAAPVIADAPAGPPANYHRVNQTVVATAIGADESVIDVAIDPAELLESGILPPHRLRRRTPTFETLAVVAPPSRLWLYATSAAVVVLAVLLLIMP
jgi:hypothetical protein